MSDQLTISACFSVLAMAALAIASPQITSEDRLPANETGAAISIAAPALDAVPGLPALADLIR